MLGMFQESRGHVPGAEQGVAWEEVRSSSESVFRGWFPSGGFLWE